MEPYAKTMFDESIKAPGRRQEKQLTLEAAAAERQLQREFLKMSADQQREFLASQGELNRQSKHDLKAMPSIHISTGGAPSGDFGGPAVQVGTNPRDDSPVYRHTKSGKLFSLGDTGAQAYAGAVAPKQKEATEGERTSAGFLGRMDAAEKLLAGIKGGEQTLTTSVVGKLPLGGSYARNRMETDAQQKYRQAAED